MDKFGRRIPSGLTYTLIGVVLGALASWLISSYFARRLPVSLPELESQARVSLWARNYQEALSAYTKATAQEPNRTQYWEGQAYSYIGLAVGDEFDLGLLARSETVERWIKLRQGKAGSGYLEKAYLSAEAAFNTASNSGERAAAYFLLGLARELAGASDYLKYSLSPSPHYENAIRELREWENSQLYSEVGAYGVPGQRRYTLPWSLPWQAYSIRPLCTYREAIEEAILRRAALSVSPDSELDYLQRVFQDSDPVEDLLLRMRKLRSHYTGSSSTPGDPEAEVK